jgi:hypothetical protein
MSEPNEVAINTAVTYSGKGSNFSLDVVGKATTDVPPVVLLPNASPMQRLTGVADFRNRYISLDALQSSDDGADIAYLRVLKFDNGKFGDQVFPISSSRQSKYQSFIVSSVSKGDIEKAQILKTNNTLQVYAFDAQPEILNIQGILKSTVDNKWDTAMVLLWDGLLRLTKLVQNKFIVEFGYKSNVYWGYPLNFQTQESSNAQYLVSYSMSFLIVKRSMTADIDNVIVNDIQQQLASIFKV